MKRIWTFGAAGLCAGAMAATVSLAQSGGGYVTQIQQPVLPASFYARYTGHNLAPAICNQQAEALGWTARMNQINAGNDNVLRMRAIIASLEALLVISRQCEETPGARTELDNFTNSRNGAITTCRQIASNPASCLQSPF
jgi:hypothetical protein